MNQIVNDKNLMKSKTRIHRQKVSLNLTVIIVKPVMIKSAVTKEKIGGLTVQEVMNDF